jgi:hypothetical protein
MHFLTMVHPASVVIRVVGGKSGGLSKCCAGRIEASPHRNIRINMTIIHKYSLKYLQNDAKPPTRSRRYRRVTVTRARVVSHLTGLVSEQGALAGVPGVLAVELDPGAQSFAVAVDESAYVTLGTLTSAADSAGEGVGVWQQHCLQRRIRAFLPLPRYIY